MAKMGATEKMLRENVAKNEPNAAEVLRDHLLEIGKLVIVELPKTGYSSVESCVCEIIAGESIRIRGKAGARYGELVNGKRETVYPEFDRTFKIGDIVKWGSYNLSYMGPIKSISASRVGVWEHEAGKGHRSKSLKLGEFVWRNWDMDVAKKSAENSETMMYI